MAAGAAAGAVHGHALGDGEPAEVRVMRPQRFVRPEPAIDLGASPMVRRFTLIELISCAERDARSRKQNYPRLVASKQMSRALAEREVAMMGQIAAELRELAAAK